MLHRVGGRFAQPLGQLPAVLALASAQQTLHIAQTARSQLRTHKQPCDQAMRGHAPVITHASIPTDASPSHKPEKHTTEQSPDYHLSITVVLSDLFRSKRCYPHGVFGRCRRCEAEAEAKVKAKAKARAEAERQRMEIEETYKNMDETKRDELTTL